MSVTTSSASLDPPPHLFGQRSPSPPSFVSPRSPPPVSHSSPPPALQMDDDEVHDVDMATSGILNPQAQNHDRQNPFVMQSTQGDQATSGALPDNETGGDDAMDTTPDSSPHPADMQAAGQSASPNSPRHETPGIPGDNQSAGTGSVAPALEERTDTEESSEDEEEDEGDGYTWQEVQEDHSVPDEHELKDLENRGEHSALDDAYWEKLTYVNPENPEYRPGPTGQIEWAIETYNGTKEAPNRELLMKSPVVRVGGHDWQIKFYPRGNDSDYLSVYVECISIASESSKKKDRVDSKGSRSSSKSTSRQASWSVDPVSYQHTPLPLMDSEQVPKRISIAAQVCVVLYNPSEPRVHYNRSALHRFCPYSPDWGWTRFHGPHFQIGQRHRGQRQALLRNDKLALRAFIRVMSDDTDCLWEHATRENPWDSFSMTGLQSLVSGPQISKAFVPAIWSWLLFRPFRKLIYDIDAPDPVNEARVKPMPLVGALQKILYSLRHLPSASPSDRGWRQPVNLEVLMDAFHWYGIVDLLREVDVIEVWDVIRAKLEEELLDSPFHDRLEELFGCTKNLRNGLPTYRVTSLDLPTLQDAINDTANLISNQSAPPELLQVELKRQRFDPASRSWKRDLRRMKLDEHVVVDDHGYSLYGMIIQSDSLQSGMFNAVLRPNGPGGGWYRFSDKSNFSDGKEDLLVVCLPRSQAVDNLEGFASPTPQQQKLPVAYTVLYVRDDLAEAAFHPTHEPIWNPPQWVVDEVKSSRVFPNGHGSSESPFDLSQPSTTIAPVEKKTESADAVFEMQIFNSQAFLEHEGPGFIDLYDREWENSSYVLNITVNESDDALAVRDKIAAVAPNVRDPRQIKFWIMDQSQSYLKPDIKLSLIRGPAGKHSNHYLFEEAEWPGAERRLWYHVTNETHLVPVPPEEKEAVLAGPSNPQPVDWSSTSRSSAPNAGEDTLMSEAEDDVPNNVVPSLPAVRAMERLAEILEAAPETPGLGLIPPPPAISMPRPPCPIPGEIYFFLKEFDANTQTLRPIGSYLVKRGSRVDHTIQRILNAPKDPPIAMYEEQAISRASPLRRRKTFEDLSLSNACVIIIQHGAAADTSELAARAAFSDPATYLENLAEDRKFRARREGVFVFDYFGSEVYVGHVKAHMPHGQGTRVYFNGDTYTGYFQLGKRHGKGTMIYTNSDTYTGDWVNDLKHGEGSYTEAETKNTYAGGWKDNKRFGEGVTHWKLAQEAERLCRICWEESAEAAFYDCGHVVACMNCARRVDQCPVCRKRVTSALKLYYVT